MITGVHLGHKHVLEDKEEARFRTSCYCLSQRQERWSTHGMIKIGRSRCRSRGFKVADCTEALKLLPKHVCALCVPGTYPIKFRSHEDHMVFSMSSRRLSARRMFQAITWDTLVWAKCLARSGATQKYQSAKTIRNKNLGVSPKVASIHTYAYINICIYKME